MDSPTPNATASTPVRGQVGLMQRFRRDRLSMVGMVVLAAIFACAALSLPFSREWYNVQALTQAVRHPPSASPVVPLAYYTGPIGGNTGDATISGADKFAHRFVSWMGHDDLGRSLFYRIWPALIVSLLIGSAAAVTTAVIGTLWGAVAAMAGGRVDLIMMRIVDVLFGLPYVLMVILLKTGLTRPLTALCGGRTELASVLILLLAIGGVSWLTMARVVRGQVLSLRSQPFIEAARAVGGGPFYILRRHILPNLAGPVAVYAVLVVPQAVLQEAFLSFLGIGVQQPLPSLGRLAADGVEAVNTFVSYWWLLVFPCGMLVVTLVLMNFVADGLRNALDPRSSTTPTM